MSASAMLANRRIVLGVPGGIAAYKAVDLCRRLVDNGAHVVPVLTETALRFVGRVTFDALASEAAQTSLWQGEHPIPHARLGHLADAIVVAPATARLIAAYRMGLSDDLLTATLIATEAPVVICPAMHSEMWEHPAVQENLRVLAERGVTIVPPEEGRLAGGDTGRGRLADPADIVRTVVDLFTSKDMGGVSVLVTAGGTREPIDPVRFIGNRSSGKQGHALAEEALARGAKVTLVTSAPLPVASGIEVVRVETAAEMERAVREGAPGFDIIAMAAAVADFRPAQIAEEKIKKQEGAPAVDWEATPDILASLGSSKRPGRTRVGVGAETAELRKNAADKLERKGADLIVANDVSIPGAGFEHDTNQVLILSADGTETETKHTDKREIAGTVLDAIMTSRAGKK